MINIEGKIKKIFDTQSFGSPEKPFNKRIFWIEEVSESYPNTWQLELWKDDCKMLDGDTYKVGDYITCFIDIKGNYWNKDEREGVGNTLKCWNIQKEGKTFKPIRG